jgi:glycosyltransferase involved in cell wall biosynthesis
MREATPAVTAVIPLYQTERYIAEALDSVLAQTFQDWEAIVVDDGSHDCGPDIARRYALRDERIRVVRQENRGLAGARNTGIRHARGSFIALLDADDLWMPEKLARHVEHLRTSAEVGVSYAGSRFIDDSGRPMRLSQRPRLDGITAAEILCRNPVGNGSAAVLRREALDDVAFVIDAPEGPRICWFDESFRQSEDIEMWVRIAATTRWQFAGLTGEETAYRVSTGGLSANVERQLASWYRMRDKLQPLAPALFAAWGSRAEAYQLRYLARRAALSGDGVMSARLVSRALASHPPMIWEEPVRTLQTLALATASTLLPRAAFDELKRGLIGPAPRPA